MSSPNTSIQEDHYMQRTAIRIIGKANTLSQQLADLQHSGICPSGPAICDPITGLSYDQIRDIQNGDYMGPLPITSKPGFDGRRS